MNAGAIGPIRRSPVIEDLFAGPHVVAYEGPASERHIVALTAAEAEATERMVASRAAEFATARACAAAALAVRGHPAGVRRRDDGSPQWPAGVTGSISHTRGWCAAVVDDTEHRSIGLDIEEADRVGPHIARRILTEAEALLFDRIDGDAAAEWLATVFAAKEAFYKAHYQVEPRYLGFGVVEVDVGAHEPAGARRITFRPGDGTVATRLVESATGRARLVDGRILVGVSITPGSD